MIVARQQKAAAKEAAKVAAAEAKVSPILGGLFLHTVFTFC